MRINNINILHGLPPERKGRLAEIYYEAFGPKLSILLKPGEKAIELLRSAINTDRGFYAVKDGKLIGFLGYEIKDRPYSDFSFNRLRRAFGLARAAYISLIFRLAGSPPIKEGQVMVDTFAVTREMRKRGAGALIFDHFLGYARRKGFREVLLEVIDTNTKAFKLYKKFGFRKIETRRYYFLAQKLGFFTSLTMLKEL
ncbi:MAG: GNAT family N-acetyltransferase [Actinomycetota bacterium]